MTKIRTVICDDERPALDLLAGILRDTGKVEIIAQCQSAADALAVINAGGVDVVFLDVEMPELTGVEAVQDITIDPKPLIVFATAHAEYAVDAFGIDAIDYILKPIDTVRVERAVDKALRLLRLIQQGRERGSASGGEEPDLGTGSADALRLSDAGRHHIIPYEDIIWIEAAGDYSLLHRRGSELAVRRTISSLEQELPHEMFLRVHRSSIISARHVTQVQRRAKGEATLQLTGGTEVRTSRSYRAVIATLIGDEG